MEGIAHGVGLESGVLEERHDGLDAEFGGLFAKNAAPHSFHTISFV